MCMPPYSKQIRRNWMVEHILTVIKKLYLAFLVRRDFTSSHIFKQIIFKGIYASYIYTELYIRMRTKTLYFVFINQNMLWDGSFEHPAHIL